MKHVVLVGLSGSGKSTIGPTLAERLGRAFVDTDDLIVERVGMPIAQLFAQRGEPAFRAIERDAVAAAVDREASVIATGGGAPVDPGNRGKLWDGNLVVWLDAPLKVLVQRVGDAGHGRPLLRGGAAVRLARLHSARAPIYQTANLRIRTEITGVEGAICAILDRLQDGA